MAIRTIGDLKAYLQHYINELSEKYGEACEVDITGNTYFLKSKTNFIGTKDGFISLDYPVNDEMEDF